MHLISPEAQIIRHTIEALLRAGYSLGVRVPDGEILVDRSYDYGQLIHLMGTASNDILTVYQGPGPLVGWVQFVYGNGLDVIVAYSTNLEPVISQITIMIEKFEKGE